MTPPPTQPVALTPRTIELYMRAVCKMKDQEMRHLFEDDFMLRILTRIAEGAPQAQLLARAFVDNYNKDLPRWYA